MNHCHGPRKRNYVLTRYLIDLLLNLYLRLQGMQITTRPPTTSQVATKLVPSSRQG